MSSLRCSSVIELSMRWAAAARLASESSNSSMFSGCSGNCCPCLFMNKHGQQFPEHPENIDELLDSLAKRAAAAQRMLNSMTEEQRNELMQLSAQAFGSPELMDQLSQLDGNLQ